LFLVTLLSTPTRHFEIAFHMFDLDGNGNIDIDEFDQLQQIIRNQTSTGQRHRDTHMTGSVIKGNSVLNNYFFGPNLDQLLTVDKFTKFQKSLQSEVVRMEFNYTSRHVRKDGVKIIREVEFCEMILAYAGLPNSKTKKMLKHISSIYSNNEEHSVGITLEEFETFFQVLRSIHDIDIALKFYSIAGASIDKVILKHVSKTVAEADLSDHVIDVMFNLFDDNGDGKLSHREFIKVMKRRLARGLSSPKDTGFVNFVEALGSCTKDIFFSK
jgi:Ca2+-binding EF-hand superfamily protein